MWFGIVDGTACFLLRCKESQQGFFLGSTKTTIDRYMKPLATVKKSHLRSGM